MRKKYQPGKLPSLIPRVQICLYCGLSHKLVEAGGIYHCPNPCCLGPGQSYQRSKLKSYKKIDGGWRHTVDVDELFDAGVDKALATKDRVIITQALVSIVLHEWKVYMEREKESENERKF